MREFPNLQSVDISDNDISNTPKSNLSPSTFAKFLQYISKISSHQTHGLNIGERRIADALKQFWLNTSIEDDAPQDTLIVSYHKPELSLEHLEERNAGIRLSKRRNVYSKALKVSYFDAEHGLPPHIDLFEKAGYLVQDLTIDNEMYSRRYSINVYVTLWTMFKDGQFQIIYSSTATISRSSLLYTKLFSIVFQGGQR